MGLLAKKSDIEAFIFSWKQLYSRHKITGNDINDNYEVRDAIDKETLSTVKAVGDNYKYGFSTDIETEYAPLGLNEDIVKLISRKNNEPEWMLDWRLKAFTRWKTYNRIGHY